MNPYDFNYFKNNVSIIQAAEAVGYEFNPRAGKLRLEFNHKTESDIIISNPKDPSRQVYFTRNEDSNRGSVIDFVKHRLHMFNIPYQKEIEGINKVLSQLAQVPYDLNNTLTTIQVADKGKQSNFNPEDYKILDSKINLLGYLSKERGLSEDTLTKFSPFIKLVQYNKPGKFNYTNIGFPYSKPGQDGITGIEIVNYNFKQHAINSDKTNSVWLAAERGIMPTRIFFAESAIDAMSFYQLNKHKYNLNETAFISTGGALSTSQIKNVLEFYPYAKVHTIFDNDISGKIFDIRVAAIKSNIAIEVTKRSDEVEFKLPKMNLTMPMEAVSLTKLKELTGLRPDVTVHKSEFPNSNKLEHKFKDFNEMLKNSIPIKENMVQKR